MLLFIQGTAFWCSEKKQGLITLLAFYTTQFRLRLLYLNFTDITCYVNTFNN